MSNNFLLPAHVLEGRRTPTLLTQYHNISQKIYETHTLYTHPFLFVTGGDE